MQAAMGIPEMTDRKMSEVPCTTRKHSIPLVAKKKKSRRCLIIFNVSCFVQLHRVQRVQKKKSFNLADKTPGKHQIMINIRTTGRGGKKIGW